MTIHIYSLLRLRQEVAKLILRHAQQIKDPAGSAKMQSRLYDGLLQGFTVRDPILLANSSLIVLVSGCPFHCSPQSPARDCLLG